MNMNFLIHLYNKQILVDNKNLIVSTGYQILHLNHQAIKIYNIISLNCKLRIH